jgi:ABC-type Zn uptake system ZnuABC Zn-binding protein ZnuA
VIGLLLLLLLPLLAAVPAWGGGTLSVVATSTDLKALVEVVGGERVSVESLTAPQQDPHAVEVKPGQLARLKRADLLVRIGLDHEPWLPAALAAAGALHLAAGRAGDVDVSRDVRLLQTETARVRDSRGAAHVHGFGNTHYWLDPDNARPITAVVARALGRLSPADASRLDDNRRRFLQRLDAGLARWTRALAPYRGARVVVVHETWPYFAERFGLAVVAAVEPAPGLAPSPASLATLIERMRTTGVRVIVADPYSDPALVDRLAARTGARVARLVSSVGGDPEAMDYIALFDLDVRRLVEALAS